MPDLAPPITGGHLAHERLTLANGLTVILHPDPSLPQVVVNVWVSVGSKDETAGRSGFAHLFEHLMFMGTARAPGGAFDRLMEAHGGWNNAWTSEDATDFYDVGPSNLLQTLLWLEADRLAGLGRAMTQEKLDLQREVVRNERRQSYEDEPYGAAWLLLPGVMYPEGHPYRAPVIGSHGDLVAATVHDVAAFFSTWYVPNNVSLVVAGDFDVAETRQTVARLFGGLVAGPTGPRAAPDPMDRPQVPCTELTDKVTVAQTVLAWHSPAAFAPGDADLDLLASILGAGRSSRLYHRLVYQEQRAQEVSATQMSQALGSLFLIIAKPTEGHTVEEIEAAVREELDRVAALGPTEAEMDRARNQFEMSFLRGLEGLAGRASALNRYQAQLGVPDGVALDLARYRGATAASVQAAARALTADRCAILRVRPQGSPA